MDITQFQTAWKKSEENLQPVAAESLNRFDLTTEAFTFLNSCGLPEEAAPFLTFVGNANPADKYSSIGLLTEWFDFLEPEFSNYLVVGSCCDGDIIALNMSEKCKVEWLDHEDNFSPRFINSTVTQLACCLLAYRNFIASVNNTIVGDEYHDTAFTDTQFDTLRDILESIDSKSIKEGFWEEQLDMLLANRQEARNES